MQSPRAECAASVPLLDGGGVEGEEEVGAGVGCAVFCCAACFAALAAASAARCLRRAAFLARTKILACRVATSWRAAVAPSWPVALDPALVATGVVKCTGLGAEDPP